ncbi:ATP-binding protein, partial [Streptomyces sp. NPDC059477]|uniref:ATP-binding protein n=1 Tax=Streptomyces sp. NPDC059477 TaxID=3346847 RepID=UPI0036C319DE
RSVLRPRAPGGLTRVFDRFWRARDHGTTRDRHAGLGLAIVRQIVESHGGQIRLFSKLGEGSTFVLWFPTPAETTRKAPPEEPPVPQRH